MSFQISRHAEVTWQGTDTEGGGRFAFGSRAFEGPFTLKNRIEEVDRGTNPEELIAAAEAGCYTMSLANLLTEEGHPPDDLRTTARVRLEQTPEGFRITRIAIKTVGDVPGVDAEQFAELAKRAKETCPVSLALAGTEITLETAMD